MNTSCFDLCDSDCVTPPQPLWFKVVSKTSGANLIAEGVYEKDSIKVFYFEGSTKKLASIRFVGPIGQNNIIETNIGMLLPFEELNTFYIYLNYLDTDTVKMRIVKRTDGCCSSYPLDSISINGKAVEVDGFDYSFLIKK